MLRELYSQFLLGNIQNKTNVRVFAVFLDNILLGGLKGSDSGRNKD